jgi:hypothetical protein
VFVGAVDVLSIRMPPISCRIEIHDAVRHLKRLHLISGKATFFSRQALQNNCGKSGGDLKNISTARGRPKSILPGVGNGHDTTLVDLNPTQGSEPDFPTVY